MYKRVLISLDLEGVNRVVGEPYSGLVRDTEQWHIAREQATLEVNEAADALFEAGVEVVGLWDYHAASSNVDVNALDPRITVISTDPHKPRLYFAEGNYDCVCYFGYHTMEGTLGGVLAHTMSSQTVQYYKLNGKYVGEVDIDAYITAAVGIPSRFFVGGDLTCEQAKRAINEIVTVTTKKEISRNEAIFRDNDELLEDIRKNIVKAVQTYAEPHPLPMPATLEKSFKRVEDAAKYLSRLRSLGINADYLDDDILGKDAHTVVSEICEIGDLIKGL